MKPPARRHLTCTEVRRAAPDQVQGTWRVEFWRGSVADLLELAEPDDLQRRVARVHAVDRPALVLGSAQPPEIADGGRADADGVELARRRSGGGVVLLAPAAQIWVDFFVPRADRLWHLDVSRAALWAGDLWAQCAAGSVDTDTPTTVHRGRVDADQWGRLVCMAGIGPGEVLCGTRKIVGVSQHRNRFRARVQTMARLAGPASTASHRNLNEFDYLSLSIRQRREGSRALAERATELRADAAQLTAALLSSLSSLG